MAREYNSRRSSRAKRSVSQQLLVIVVIFSLGYIAASFFDMASFNAWISKQVLAHHERAKAVELTHTEHSPATLPRKPKFEFYTLLTKDKNSTNQAAVHSEIKHLEVANSSASVANGTIKNTKELIIKNGAKTQEPVSVSVVEAKPAIASTPNGAYAIQVAAFKSRNDAEHMKGALTLKGFNVRVIAINHVHRGLWYRVLVGPYANRLLATKAQSDLVRTEHLKGMIITA